MSMFKKFPILEKVLHEPTICNPVRHRGVFCWHTEGASNIVQFLQYQMPDGTTRVQVTMDLPNRPDSATIHELT